jgi:hypothetical protein
MPQSHLTLFSSEYEIQNQVGQTLHKWWHSFISLGYADEAGQLAQSKAIKAHLHFNSSGGLIRPELQDSMTMRLFKGTSFFPLLSAQEDKMDVIWQQILSFSDRFRTDNIKLDDDFREGVSAINCRTAVRDSFASVGLVLCPEHTKSTAGLYAPKIFKNM